MNAWPIQEGGDRGHETGGGQRYRTHFSRYRSAVEAAVTNTMEEEATAMGAAETGFAKKSVVVEMKALVRSLVEAALVAIEVTAVEL